MPIRRTARTSGLVVAIAAVTVVAVLLLAVFTALPADSTTVGESTLRNVYRVMLGGVGGIAFGVLLITLINRVVTR